MKYLALILLLFASPAFGADGDIVSTNTKNLLKEVVFLLCDGDHSATDCGEIDTVVDLADGAPDWIVYSIVNLTGCSGTPEITVRGLSAAAGVPFHYAVLSTAGVSSVNICSPRHRFHDAVVSGTTNCTDVEIRGSAFYALKGGVNLCDD